MVRKPILMAMIVVLFVGLVVQLSMWSSLQYEKPRGSVVDIPSITKEHQKWRRRIDRAQEKRRRLEDDMLWGQPDPLLGKLSKAANELSIKLVRSEQRPKKAFVDYQSFPLQLTFSGDYARFSTLLAVVEQISPPVRVDQLRLYRRQRYPGTLMSLTVSPMLREDADSIPTEIRLPTVAPVRIERDAFAFDISEAAYQPQPHKDLPEIPLPRLTGILWEDKQPIAILTDHQMRPRSVGVGSVIATAKVVEIHPQAVVLVRGNETHELRLWEAEKGFSTFHRIKW